MSARLATLALALIVGVAFAAPTSLAVAAVWPWARRRLARAHPAARARAAWLAAVAPAALPALLVALCFLPGLLGAAGLVHDHCTHHPDHPHLCLIHATAALTPVRIALLAAAGLLAVGAVLPDVRRLGRERRWLAALPRRVAAPGSDFEIVECETPLSFAAGLWRPRVHIAAGVVRALPERQLAAVLAHERAHARRRDPLLRLTARVLSRAHLPAVRRALLADLALNSEQACDAEAGCHVGDRLAVAEAILAVERLLAGAADPAPVGLSGFGGSSVAERVHGLLAPDVRRPPHRSWLLAAGPALLAALLLMNGLHNATEDLLAFATRWL
jgi:Zn-dependent protease with chaperone function